MCRSATNNSSARQHSASWEFLSFAAVSLVCDCRQQQQDSAKLVAENRLLHQQLESMGLANEEHKRELESTQMQNAQLNAKLQVGRLSWHRARRRSLVHGLISSTRWLACLLPAHQLTSLLTHSLAHSSGIKADVLCLRTGGPCVCTDDAEAS